MIEQPTRQRPLERLVRGRSIEAKFDRVRRANALLEVIANCGRHLFAHRGTVSRLAVDERGRIWFVDAWSERSIYTGYRYQWRGFTEGGTLRALVKGLCDFIRTGEAQKINLGPWPDWYCGGDLWGYGEDKIGRASCRERV